MADLRSPHLSVCWPWHLTFWPWIWCAMSPVARTTFVPILMFVPLLVVELWANMHQTEDMTLLPWHFTLHVTKPHMSAILVIVFHPCTKFEVRVRQSPLRKIWRIFRLSINRPNVERFVSLWALWFWLLLQNIIIIAVSGSYCRWDEVAYYYDKCTKLFCIFSIFFL